MVSASETHNRRNVKRSVDESIAAAAELTALAHDAGTPVEAIVSTAFGCPYEGDVPEARVAGVAARLRDGGADRLSFGDTTGMATPARVDTLLDALGRRRDRVPTASRCTSTTPAAPGSRTWSPRSSGVSRGSTRRSVGSVAVRTRRARPATSSRRISCTCSRTWGSTPASTSTALIDCAHLAQDIVGRELPGQVMRAGPRTATVEWTRRPEAQ